MDDRTRREAAPGRFVITGGVQGDDGTVSAGMAILTADEYAQLLAYVREHSDDGRVCFRAELPDGWSPWLWTTVDL
jgi:hypothetical protein